MEKCYELRIFDTPLLCFSVSVSPLGELAVRDISQPDPKCSHLLPPTLWQPTPDSVLDWLKTRVIPKNRAFVDKICETAGLVPGDTLGIIDVCLGLSVNDSYWVVFEGFPGRWSDYNLYEHDLDAALALVAYTGRSSGERRKAGLSTEWTTSGNYPKAWRRIAGQLELYKAGSPLNEGAANPDFGPYSEFFVAQVANALGLAHVDYALDTWQGRLASTCPLFTNERVGFFSFWDCTGTSGLANVLPLARELGADVLEHAIDQYVFDAVIANPDRHANNFGFLRDSKAGSWLGPAPLFDHNRALFPLDMPQDFASWPRKARTMRQSGVSMSNKSLLSRIVGARHHEWGRRLLGLRLANDEAHPVGTARLTAIESLLHATGRWILETDTHTTADVSKWIDEDFGWNGGTEQARRFVENVTHNAAHVSLRNERPGRHSS